MREVEEFRQKCYVCFRPKSSCMCTYVQKIDTQTQFIILMHPKEFQKTKNGTGRLTHLSLANSKLFIGIDFSQHQQINAIIDDTNNNCYVLFPHKNSLKLNTQRMHVGKKNNVIFIIDSTWPCANTMLAVNPKIDNLQKVSFKHSKISNFQIKTQPNEHCLSTIESTLCVLELLNTHGCENIAKEFLENFLQPFEKMVQYQMRCALDSKGQSVRYKIPYKKSSFL
ncbi:MAG: tRNA-uridine aminocarboxypropyltransferase [Campylobacterota bacterium]|nr:tRNA-uridine aminocarboxypropyltransferase [Campylobacterota bacterium]